MRKPEPLPNSLRSAPFSVAAGLAAGVSRSRLRASDLHVPFHGVRALGMLPGAPQSALRTIPSVPTFALCHSYFPRLAPGNFFSHTTAAQLYEMPLPRSHELPSPLDVSSIVPTKPVKGRGVRGHQMRVRPPIRLIQGLPVLDPAFVWCQLALLLSHEQLVAVGDHLVRRKRPQSSLEHLRLAIEFVQPNRGVRAARLALERVREKTDSPRETLLRLLIVDAGLPEPLIGHKVNSHDGRFVATPDLAYVSERIAIEYEGSIHQTDAQTYQNDIYRRERLEEAGWLVIRVIALHLRDPVRLVARIAAALRAKAT